ncbi:hypothetical protein CVT25_010451 [Psilocybe cyanescens]|uniref:PARP-type domain-containing protein n=1 Tax=Psilocybe cyanescens TaxID=93625 RepID=A0A409VTY4_PSICY|nr:hypothetical protein CVT25_010451 [Psilocybe cyanescens]
MDQAQERTALVIMQGTLLGKRELCFGTPIQKNIEENKWPAYIWRHWRCVSTLNIRNAKKKCNEAAGLEGFDTLSPEDQVRVIQAWQDEDIVSNVDAASIDGHDNPGGLFENLILSDGTNDVSTDVNTRDTRPLGPNSPEFTSTQRETDEVERSKVYAASYEAQDGEPTVISGAHQESQAHSHSYSSQRDMINSYMENPTTIVGKKFKFTCTNSQEIWEVSDILFDKQGWSSVTIQHHHPMNSDRWKETQKFKFYVFIDMLRQGVLLGSA